MTSGRRVPCRRRCASRLQPAHDHQLLLFRRMQHFVVTLQIIIFCPGKTWRASLGIRTPTFRRNLLPSSSNRWRLTSNDVTSFQTVPITLPSDGNYELHRCENLRASHLTFGRCQQLMSGWGFWMRRVGGISRLRVQGGSCLASELWGGVFIERARR
jgi:hypothetical protein